MQEAFQFGNAEGLMKGNFQNFHTSKQYLIGCLSLYPPFFMIKSHEIPNHIMVSCWVKTKAENHRRSQGGTPLRPHYSVPVSSFPGWRAGCFLALMEFGPGIWWISWYVHGDTLGKFKQYIYIYIYNIYIYNMYIYIYIHIMWLCINKSYISF